MCNTSLSQSVCVCFSLYVPSIGSIRKASYENLRICIAERLKDKERKEHHSRVVCEQLLLYTVAVPSDECISTVNSVLLVFRAPFLSHRKRVCGNDVKMLQIQFLSRLVCNSMLI